MKKTKILLTLVCAILLVAASVMGTLAYLTSTPDAVVNTFTVGANVEITLDEAKTNDLGQKLDKDNKVYTEGATLADRVKANEYKLLPGHEYVKDPTVHVTGGDCYVFVTVTNSISAIEADTTIANQMTAKGWKAVEGYQGVYVYADPADSSATKTIVSGTTEAPKDLAVFEKFTVKSDLGNDSLTNYETTKENGVNITIKAYAIQSDGFENKTAAEIWKDNFAPKDNT